MTDTFQNLDEAAAERVAAIARELAEYGLGIFVPHMHTDAGGTVPLPPGIVSCENDLSVSFMPADSVPLDSVPVGWRWQNGAIEACTKCCFGAPNK